MKKDKEIKGFYNGKVFYDFEQFLEAVKNFPDLTLSEKDFNWLFSMVAKNIWINLKMYKSIPKGKDFNEWLNEFFFATLEKFMDQTNVNKSSEEDS